MPHVPPGDHLSETTKESTDDAHAPADLFFVENAFFILDLPHTASALEVERQGQKLIGMLELGHAGADVYHTPLGEYVRTPELVRQSVAKLRDPDKRFLDEIWARASQSVRARPARLLNPEALWWWGRGAESP